MSPAELWVEFQAAEAMDRDTAADQVTQAYHTVRIWLMSHRRDGKLQLPKLQTLLNELKPKRAKSPTEQLAILYSLGRQYGIAMRDATPEEIESARGARVH